MGKLEYDKKKGINMRKEMKDIERDVYETADFDTTKLRNQMMDAAHAEMEAVNKKKRRSMGFKD